MNCQFHIRCNLTSTANSTSTVNFISCQFHINCFEGRLDCRTFSWCHFLFCDQLYRTNDSFVRFDVCTSSIQWRFPSKSHAKQAMLLCLVGLLYAALHVQDFLSALLAGTCLCSMFRLSLDQKFIKSRPNKALLLQSIAISTLVLKLTLCAKYTLLHR